MKKPECRCIARIGVIAAILAGASASTVWGQDVEVSLDSLDQAVGLDALSDAATDLVISGFGVASFDYESGRETSSLAATKLAISAFKRMGPAVSFFGQFTTLFESEPLGAVEEEPIAGGGGEEGPPLETEIDNLIISITPPGTDLSVWFGRFDAPFGFERDDEPLNFQPTTSFNFAFARPVKLTGLLANYTPLPQLSVSGFVVNGWDVAVDNNKGKTVGGRVSFLPYEKASVSVTGMYGPEQDDNTDDQRFLLDADFTLQPAREVILGGEFNFGTEEAVAPDGGDADWIGGVFTAFFRLTRQFGITARYDVFDDTDGSRTGEARTLQSFTLAPMWFFRSAVSGIFSTIPQTSFSLPEFAVRAGLRFNHSDDPFFPTEDGLQRSATQLVVEGVFVY